MINNKVIIALQALSVYELNRLGKFILSPYFNKNKQITSHFDLLTASIKNNELQDLDKEAIWKNAYGTTKFNDNKLRKLNTDLLKLVEEFLAVEGFQKNPLHQANYLLKAIADKKIEKLYNSTISTVKRLSKQQLEKPASYYYYQYQIEKNVFNLTSEYERKTKTKSELANFNISKIADNLDIFYLTEKIRYLNTLLTWQNVTKHEQTIKFRDDLIKQIQDIDYQSYPALNIYYTIYLSTIEPDNPSHYEDLVKSIKTNIDLFSKPEAKDIFEAAINYCVRKANKGDSNYLQELFEIYEFGLEYEIILVDGEITPTSFRNICFIGLRLKKFDWTEDFIAKYSLHLDEKYRKNAVTFNLARLYWYQKKFRNVIEQLRDVEYADIFYNLNSKVILLSTYYELDEYEALDFLIKSFKVFLSRKSNLPDRMRSNYQNFTKYLERLTKLDLKDNKKLETYLKDLKEEKKIASKFWLKEKAEELSGVSTPR